jgi:hypothetical protein
LSYTAHEIIYRLLGGFSVQLGGFCSLRTKISGTYHGVNGHNGAENLPGCRVVFCNVY